MIIRRPHAYKFSRQYEGGPIPGLVVLNADGKILGGVRLPSSDAVSELVKLFEK